MDDRARADPRALLRDRHHPAVHALRRDRGWIYRAATGQGENLYQGILHQYGFSTGCLRGGGAHGRLERAEHGDPQIRHLSEKRATSSACRCSSSCRRSSHADPAHRLLPPGTRVRGGTRAGAYAGGPMEEDPAQPQQVDARTPVSPVDAPGTPTTRRLPTALRRDLRAPVASTRRTEFDDGAGRDDQLDRDRARDPALARARGRRGADPCRREAGQWSVATTRTPRSVRDRVRRSSPWRRSSLSDLIRSSGAWWAQSSKHARLTAVGTTAILVVLGSSPGRSGCPRPVRVHRRPQGSAWYAAEEAGSPPELQTKLTAAQEKIWASRASSTPRPPRPGRVATRSPDLKAQLASLQSQLGLRRARSEARRTPVGRVPARRGRFRLGGSGSSRRLRSSNGSGSGSGGARNHGVTNPNGGPSKDPARLRSPSRPGTDHGAAGSMVRPLHGAVALQLGRVRRGVAAGRQGHEHDRVFQGFDQDFNASAVQRSWANGPTAAHDLGIRTRKTATMRSTSPATPTRTIVSGKFDAYLTKYARPWPPRAADVIRLDHEMKRLLVQLVGRHRTAERRRVLRRDVAARARRSSRPTAPTSTSSGTGRRAASTSSGTTSTCSSTTCVSTTGVRSYVDWVGMSGYYAPPPSRRRSTTRSARPSLSSVSRTGQEDHPQRDRCDRDRHVREQRAEAKWITSHFRRPRRSGNDDVIGFSYFSEAATTIVDGTGPPNDWRLNSRADSLQAFVDGIARTDTTTTCRRSRK